MFRIAPMFFYDPAIIQAWLEDHARQGRFVYEYKGFGASFWREEPKEVRFRVEPSRTDGERPDWETQELYRSMGWEYVCPMDRAYDIWRCDDPAAPELNTDPQVQAAGYDAMFRQHRTGRKILLAVWLPVVLTAVLVTLGSYDRSVESWEPWYIDLVRYGILAALLLLLGVASWRQGIYLKALRAGVPQPHRRSYRAGFVMTWLALALMAAFAVVQVADWLQPNSHSFLLVSEYAVEVPFVEIEGAGDVRAVRWENWRTREQWWMIQHPEDYSSRIFVESRYYDFWFGTAAARMERNLLENWGGDVEQVDVAGLDAVWHGVDGEHNYLLACKDTRLFYLYCRTETADLLDYVKDCRELLTTH